MPHGGRRPGAGRKSNAEITTVRALLDRAIDESRWQTLIDKIWDRALRGDIRAAQLLLSYRFGNPYAEEPEPQAPPISIIEVRRTCPHCGHRSDESAATLSRESAPRSRLSSRAT